MTLRYRVTGATFAAALAGLFAFTLLFRFLLLKGGFPNDHFLFLAGAQQIRFGEWPTRDFLDPGLPLMYLSSVAAQILLGPPLYAEAVLVAVAFAAGAVLTALAVLGLTRSRWLALIAGIVEIAMVPRTYGYPKVLVYAAAFFLLQRYVARPTSRRLLALAAGVVIAFLFRHDHGVYLGAAAAVAAWLAPVTTASMRPTRRVATLALMLLLLVAPYVAYVQVVGGVRSYLQNGLEFRSSEFDREWHVWPTVFGDRPFDAMLLYEYWSIPIAAALVLVARRRTIDRADMAAAAALVVTTLLVNFTFLRRPLQTRLPDAIVPAVTLGAWLLHCAWQSRRRWVWRPAGALLLLLFVASVTIVGQTAEQLERANLDISWTRLPEVVSDVATSLQAPRDERQIPSALAVSLMPFYAYVDRCTTHDHRLLAIGFLPEVFVFAHRAFAGGQPAFVSGYYESDRYQQSVIAKLQHQIVPFALIPAEEYGPEFDTGFPLLARYVAQRYQPLATLGENRHAQVVVLVDRTLPAPSRDAMTSWPCFR